MEFAEVVRARRMVRAYRPDPVDPAALERILDTARRGPSAGFTQALEFVVRTDAAERAALAELCGEADYRARGFPPWLSEAPVHVVPCVRPAAYAERYGEPDKAGSRPPAQWSVPYWWVDAGAGLQLLLLAAVDEGLGAGLLALTDTPALRALLALPDDVAPLGLVTIGHPDPERERGPGSAARGRRPLRALVHHGRWGGQRR